MKDSIVGNPEQILLFFNNVTNFQDIVDQIKDDPKFGKSSKKAYGIRKKLAQRILSSRNRLPKKQFQSLEQLDSIKGIGKDTMHDIIVSLGRKIKPDDVPPVKLDDILTGITGALVNVKSHMDETSIEVAKKYIKNDLMSSLSLPFFSISNVKLNLRFVIQKQSSRYEDTLVSVNSEYLKKLPKSMISEINLELNPQKTIWSKTRDEPIRYDR
ncbi:MAG: helix-hairpin-helix domain-containing protein [Nitrosopumilus sp.]|nr:helix-hairpin-helix domain-containing protein [Nitrosopumilus sp.]